jgi:hypothetical protein
MPIPNFISFFPISGKMGSFSLTLTADTPDQPHQPAFASHQTHPAPPHKPD